MDAITLLKNDHQKVRQLLSQLTEEESADKRQTLLDQIAVELEAHTAIEEEIFYPAFRKAGEQHDDEKMYFEAMEEHRAAGDLVLPDLKGTQPDSEKFGGRAKVLKELIEHHADEEEKGCSRARARCSAPTGSRSSARGWKRASRNCCRR